MQSPNSLFPTSLLVFYSGALNYFSLGWGSICHLSPTCSTQLHPPLPCCPHRKQKYQSSAKDDSMGCVPGSLPWGRRFQDIPCLTGLPSSASLRPSSFSLGQAYHCIPPEGPWHSHKSKLHYRNTHRMYHVHVKKCNLHTTGYIVTTQNGAVLSRAPAHNMPSHWHLSLLQSFGVLLGTPPHTSFLSLKLSMS